MALVLRTVTGTIKKASGAEWEGGKVSFSLVSTQTSAGGVIVPNLTVEVIAGPQGAFSVGLYTLEDSYLNYFVMLPTGETQEISLPDGEGEALLADLLETAAQAEEIAIRPATESTLGGVMVDGSTITVDGEGVISAVGGGGVTDHGALSGLADDDHPQYLNTARGDARYVGAAPAGLNTLEELAAAIDNDPTFSTTVTDEFTNVLYKAQNLADLPNPATAKTNLGLGNVDNTSDANKPVSTAQQAALDAKVGLTGNETIDGVKTFSSSPVVPTPTTDFQAATKKYVDDNAGGGGIGGDVGANDNAIVRTDGTTGDAVQGSSAFIDDSGNLRVFSIVQGTNGQETIVRSPAGGGSVRLQNAFLETGVLYGDDRRVRFWGVTLTPTRPAQITGDQNDYALGNANSTVVYINSDAARNITGVASTLGTGSTNSEGMWHRLINSGGFAVTLKHEDTASVAANRFLNSTGADIVLSPNQGADIHYDLVAGRWRVFKLA